MCYHKQLDTTFDSLLSRYNVGQSPQSEELFKPVYHENGFSFLGSPLVCADSPSSFTWGIWGFVPFWSRSEEDALMIRGKTLNCISEEMATKPSFREAVKRGQRCLVPCTGFFEWRHIGKNKYPYFIRSTKQKIFSLAGLYSDWDTAGGKKLRTYTVLTTSANRLMEQIHNSKKRMPVIVSDSSESKWIGGGELMKDEISEICKPYDTQWMEAYSISKLITDRKALTKNIPEVTEYMNYPELSEILS